MYEQTGGDWMDRERVQMREFKEIKENSTQQGCRGATAATASQ